MRTAATLALLLAAAAPAAAQDAGFQQREAQNYADAFARPLVWGSDPAFAASPSTVDPARDVGRWHGVRGQALAVSFENRYGETLKGHLYRPLQGEGPFPAVVIVSGAGNAESSYWWAAEDLAEHGYVALTFDPQGQGESDADPDERYCDPNGAWRGPQELGLREQGACAGQNPDGEDVQENQEQAVFIAQAKTGHVDPESIGPTYRALAPRFIFGAFDATAFLLSGANPWRAAIDASRVGVAGHSLGSYAADMVGNGDPHHRFRAAVAMDAYYANDLDVQPRVPTLIMQSEQEAFIGPHPTPPAEPRSPRTLHPTRSTYAQFGERGVDAGFVVLRASTHDEFTDLARPASRVGQRTASRLLLAWMDEYVAGRPGTTRLLARTADDSADVSSIGTGAPHIAGTPVENLLSELYPSDLTLGSTRCFDLRTSTCAAPPPCTARIARQLRRVRGLVRARVTLRRSCGRVHLVRARLRTGRRAVRATGLLAAGERLDLKLSVAAKQAVRLTANVGQI
jgi:hypothetical protein